MTDSTVRFGLLVSMFQAMLRDRSSQKKRQRLRTFLDRVYTGREYFSALRLILPSLDRDRGSYGLKESALANALIDALGIAKDSPDALRLLNWRKAGARAGANAGNFALVAAEVLQRRQGMTSGGLTIKELNDALDKLASSDSRGEKAAVLSGLINKTNALEMKWIIMIIIKDLKLGISEKSIFHEFHPDAEDFFNVTCDLKLVCEKLKDRSQRQKKQDIEVGKAVRPQLAMRVSDATTAWKKLHGKQVVVECKFDGDRIQIHKNGDEIHYFSRNFFDHPEYSHGMSKIIMQNIMVDRCILDGEMLVWDTSTQRFAEFGSNQEIAKAAREGLESDRQLCYVAFDVLYAEDTSVIHQSLSERHNLLSKIVKPLKGRLEILIPDGGLNNQCPQDEPCWSLVANTVEDVEKFFKETIENRDEGIVLKDLGSKWEPGDRSGKWLKLKPDYMHAGSDLDVLIIGGYFGSGRHGGQVAQFLVGLADQSDSSSFPKRFFSFCRVGTGLSDEDLNSLVAKLKPYFRKNDNPKKVPQFYEVTKHSKERPDVWIESPDKSVILSITSDIRTIKSEVFAAPYTLRFPRILRVRYDKPWHECLDVQSLVELVQSNNGTTQKVRDHGGSQNQGLKNTKVAKKREWKNVSVLPTHFVQTDISDVKGETFIFANMVFYFVNVPPQYSVDYFHKLVVENGGTFSMNLNDAVTHCIAAEKKGLKYQAAVRQADVIHYSWVLDCSKQKILLHLQPKYYLFISDSSKLKFQEEIDPFSDYYYCDVDTTDVKQIFGNMDGSLDSKMIDYYKRKYCPKETFCLFQGCCLYFHKTVHSINIDYDIVSELTSRRMTLEITMHGGQVCDSLTHATHLLVQSTSSCNFDELYKSFPVEQRRLLHNKKLLVVSQKWLDDSLGKEKKLPEDAYNLKPVTLEELEDDQSEGELKYPNSGSTLEKQSYSTSLGKTDTRKRNRPEKRSLNKAKAATRPAQRTRARLGARAAKLGKDESDNSDSSNEVDEKGTPEKRSLHKAKAATRPAQRTRAGLGARAAKLERDESDNSNSSNEVDKKEKPALNKGKIFDIEDLKDHELVGKRNRPKKQSLGKERAVTRPVQRTRAKLGARSAKVDMDESENSDCSCEEANHKETPESIDVKTLECGDFRYNKLEGDDMKTEPSKMDRMEVDNEHDFWSSKSEESAYQATRLDKLKADDKLEQMVDPLQALLLDMVPSLQNKVRSGSTSSPLGKKSFEESTSSTFQGERLQPEAATSVIQGENSRLDNEPKPVKKKVSYKDVASQLLGDW